MDNQCTLIPVDRFYEIRVRDAVFIDGVDRVLEEAAALCREHVACRPGCVQCCTGPFAISGLDADRLRRGLDELTASDPERARNVRARAEAFLDRFGTGFPGDAGTGTLFEDEASLERFDEFANDEPCPALDPATGLCDLYRHRPLTCRVFGLPAQCGDGAVGVCELCFTGAPPAVIERCVVDPDPDGLDAVLTREIEEGARRRGPTIVAFALAR